MAEINNFIIDHVLRGVMVDKNNDYLWSINQITEPSLNITTEKDEVVDALGSVIKTLDRSKSAEFSANNSIFDLGLFAAQNGRDKEIATEEETITSPCMETYDYDGKATTYDLAHIPNEDLKTIFLLNGDGTLGKKFVVGTEADANTFVYAKTEDKATVTLPTGLTKEDQVFFLYDYEMTSGVAVTGTAVDFPKTGRFILDVLGADVCDEDVQLHAYVDFPSAKLNADVDVSFTSDGNHPFTIVCQQSYCDKRKLLYRIIIPNEE